MSLLTVGIVIALAVTIYSLIRGVSSMATGTTGGEVARHQSERWMIMRVTFQALAVVLLILLGLFVQR
jgi:hypothetical protein